MKLSIAILAALPLLVNAASIEKRGPEGSQLPALEQSLVPNELISAVDGSADKAGDMGAEACNYICLGMCCHYSTCCSNACCLPSAQFCGTDGHCYRWV